VDAMMYELANYISQNPNDKIANKRIINIFREQPKSIHKYLEDFARGERNIVITNNCADYDICTCIGPGSGYHQFLSRE
jgi:hypothetical protein